MAQFVTSAMLTKVVMYLKLYKMHTSLDYKQ